VTPGQVLLRVEEMLDPCAVVVHLDQYPSVIVTRSGDAIAAFRNKCPHAGYPLQRADGRVLVQEGRYMVCGAHGASFGLVDGACAGGPCNGDGLERVAVVVRDGAVCLV
jgi:nitrite reductase/ring-hydroxylating ferredoxin subunit